MVLLGDFCHVSVYFQWHLTIVEQPGDPFGSINSDWVNPQYLSDRHLGTHTGLMLAGMAMIMFGGLHAIARGSRKLLWHAEWQLDAPQYVLSLLIQF